MKIGNIFSGIVLMFTATTLIAAESYKEALEKGMAEYKAKKYQDAAVMLNEAAKLAKTPDEKYNSMYYQGYSLGKMRKYTEAAKIFAELKEVEELSAGQRNNAFKNYLRNIYNDKRYTDVIDVAEKTIADDKASKNMKTTSAYMACLASNRTQKYDDKTKWAKKLQEINPKGIWHSRGLIYQAQALRAQKKYKEAEEILNKDVIAKMHPYRQGDAYFELVNIKNAEKKYEEAISEYITVYNLPKGHKNHKERAIVLIIEELNSIGKPEEAKVWLERIDLIKNKYWKTRGLKCYADNLQKQNKLKEAKIKWEECKKSGKWWQKEADKQIAAIDKKLGTNN